MAKRLLRPNRTLWKPERWAVKPSEVDPGFHNLWGRGLAVLVPYWSFGGPEVQDYASGLVGTFRNGTNWSTTRNGVAHDMRWSTGDNSDVVFANSSIWDKGNDEITVIALGIPTYGNNPPGADQRGLAGTSDNNNDGWRFFSAQSGEVLRWRIPERANLDMSATSAWLEDSTVLFVGRADPDGMYLDAFDLTVRRRTQVTNTTGGSWSATGEQLVIGKAFSTNSNANFDGELLWFGLWHEALTDGEVRQIVDDPYGLFRRKIRRVYFVATVGGTTVAPAAIATTSTLPTPSLSAGASVSPAAVATSSTVPGPTPQGEALASPAVAATSSTLPTPTPAGKASVSPSAIVTSVTVPTPTVLAASTVTPSVVATVTTVPTPTTVVGGGTTVTPSEVATSSTVPTPTVLAASTVTPGAIVTVAAIPTPTPQGQASVSPVVIVTTSTLPGPTPTGAAAVTPSVINTTVAVPTPSILGTVIEITSVDHYRFYRISGNLVLAPVGRSIPSAFKSSEGYDRVSDVFRVDTLEDALASPTKAMEAVADAWAANSGADVATLKTAIHSDLQSAGFRAQGGGDLT